MKIELSDELLKETVNRLLQKGNPEKIYLFGSYARKEETETSDIDLFIIEETKLPKQKRSPRYYVSLKGLFPRKDIIVWTPKEFNEWKSISLTKKEE